MKKLLIAIIFAFIVALIGYHLSMDKVYVPVQPKTSTTSYRSTSTVKSTARPNVSPTPRPTPKPTPRSSTKAGSGKRRSLTPSPNTSGYYSAEDFYDYYWDDFSDYEEAEDYYYSHGGW